jgi:bacterioferritin (cytochrome b1)
MTRLAAAAMLNTRKARRMLESILAVEEQHADKLAHLLQDVPSGLKAKPRAAVK